MEVWERHRHRQHVGNRRARPPQPCLLLTTLCKLKQRFQSTILGRAALGPDILSRRDDPTSLTDTLSGWDIASANAQEFVHLIMDHDALSGGGGAFDEYLRVVDTFGINMEEYQKVSAAEYTIVVVQNCSNHPNSFFWPPDEAGAGGGEG